MVKRNKTVKSNLLRRPLIQKAYHAKIYCLKNFGFVADPTSTIRRNFEKGLCTKPSPFFLQPSNLAYHNLCGNEAIPIGTKQLLGLNLKYCLATNRLYNNINKTVLKLAYNIRTKTFLNSIGQTTDQEYEKQIYVRNKSWNPPPAPLLIENKLTDFEKELKKAQSKLLQKYNRINLSNLTPLQAKTLKLLKKNNNFIIKATDKNLGPAIMNKTTYIRQVLTEHLLTCTYRKLTSAEANSQIERVKSTLKTMINNNQDQLSKAEVTYFQRSLRLQHRLPIFYGLPKVHKSPVTLRPVVSGVNSLLAVFSNWLDYKLKKLLPSIKSYVKDSTTVIKELKELTIPINARLFSADATSMYTNIDTHLAVDSIKSLILDNTDSLPCNFPTSIILEILTIVMENNVFSFADTFWLQLTGTAMGTPVACSYATISFGHYENAYILREFHSNLLYYRRYIDDILGIWIPSENNNIATWNRFKESLNNWGSLKWVVEEPSHQTKFLDLNIQLKKSTITTETYQKSMNLYLYIPPLSAHPQSCFKGLIHGEIRRYWIQNNPAKFQAILLKFIQRLIDRGHTLEQLTPLITQAAADLDNKAWQATNTSSCSQDTLFIHWQHHPGGLQRSDIRKIYEATLQPHLPYKKMQIAISRPKNLRDILTKTAILDTNNINIPEIIQDIDNTSTK